MTVTDPDLLTVAQYAKKKKVTKPGVYRRINTKETPNGDIIPEVVDGRWRIRWSVYKDLSFQPRPHRTKSRTSSGT
jgi:hypothetical protein